MTYNSREPASCDCLFGLLTEAVSVLVYHPLDQPTLCQRVVYRDPGLALPQSTMKVL